jgi:TolB-like protein
MKPEHAPGDATLTSIEVRDALARIAASEEFRASPQLVAFLTFVIEALLGGDSDRIKAYTIGVEALGRSAGFDPQIDPIVRVEATRLRRTIERYYAGTGATDPVIIDLPRGSYVPSLRRREGAVPVVAPPDGAEKPAPPGVSRRMRILVPVAALVIVIGFFAPKIRLDWSSAPSATSARPVADRSAAPVLRAGNGMPTLLVQPFDVVGTRDPRAVSVGALHDMLSDAFSRFDLVNVIWEPMESGGSHQDAVAPKMPVDYRFIGSVEYYDQGAARIQFRLIDAAEGAVIWSRVFEERSNETDHRATEEAIVRELAGTLVQPFGVIYAYGRRMALTGGAGDPRYRCVLDTIETFRSFDSYQNAQARACLEQFTALDPTFAPGWSYLAAIYLREYLYGFEAHAGDAPPLERALRAAQRGVELNPAGSRAYEMLCVALFAHRDIAAAFAAGDKAINLNKYDMRTLGSYGARKIAAGEIDAGMDMLRQAGGDSAIVPAFEQFFLFVGSYMKGDLARASFRSGQLTGDSFQLGFLAHALVAFAKGDAAATQNALDRLAALNPAWRRNVRAELAKFFSSDAVIDRFAQDLTKAGLSDAN